ncbi:hypothetical protein [Nocardia gamkensis]|uniref:Uncharacterized protein n=1 Tax=Nocardia gamkensis TaxID=352869 RepID=A0A7X6R2B8_9NOCA|nr:hypothetical protein [Nocardia gamkensis]NKY26185.1 hypothetical protein [Nocardia gamkensis]NQE69296.1 hypothetical protein [Nocardia gamkensis]
MRDNSIGTGVLEVYRRDEYLVFVSAVRRGLLELTEQDREAAAAVLESMEAAVSAEAGVSAGPVDEATRPRSAGDTPHT